MSKKMMCRYTFVCFFVVLKMSIVACNNVNTNANNRDSTSSDESGITLDALIFTSTSSSQGSTHTETITTENPSTIPKTVETSPDLSQVTMVTPENMKMTPEPRLTPGEPCLNDKVMFVEVGETLLACLNNTLTIFGCKLNDGTILADGDTIVKNHYLLQCQINDLKSAANAVQIACHIDDRILGPGQTYIENQEFYTCTWRNSTNDLLLEKSGCVDHEKRKIKEGETIVNGYYQYKCVAVLDDPGTVSMRFVRDGCAFENHPYKPGHFVVIGDFWYTCEKSMEKTAQMPSENQNNNENALSHHSLGQEHAKVDYWIKPRGCIVDFGFLDVGEIFHKKGYVYKCEASIPSKNNNNPEKSDHLPDDWPFQQVRRTMIGCLEVTPKMTIVEHFPGDQWLEASRKDQGQKFTVECSVDKKERRLRKTVTKCYLDQVGEEKLDEPKTLKPGCMARIKNALWTCGGKINEKNDKKEEGIRSKLLLNAGLEDTIYAILSGFAFC